MYLSNSSFVPIIVTQVITRAGLKALAALSLVIALSTSNTANAQGVVTPTPTPSCTPDTFKATLTGSQEVPPNNSTGTGMGTVVLNREPSGATITVNLTFSGLSGPAMAAHIHAPAPPGMTAPVVIPFTNFPAATSGTYSNSFPITEEQIMNLLNGLAYMNIHTANFPGGEIRGQLLGECNPTPSPTATGTGTPNFSPSPTATATANPSATATATGTPNFSATPTATAGTSATATATATGSGTPFATPTPTFEGNFVIGDLDAVIGNRVIFWSPCWSSQNHLSGGTAPASFKGFALHPDPNPAECDGTWTSRPGNSSHPPTDVPQFITVIAASSITKNGPIISGDIPILAVVETDPDASGGGVGHPRNGTVVAITCGTAPSPTPIVSPSPGVSPTPTCGPNTFTATLTGGQEVPPNPSTATGSATVVLHQDPALTTITVNLTFSGLAEDATAAHIHGPALPGVTAPIIIPFPDFPEDTSGTYSRTLPITDEQVTQLMDGLLYINIHNDTYSSGEIRGQLERCAPVLSGLANISTRVRVETGDNVLIGGLIITGDTPKNVLLRALGLSLPLCDDLLDPILELRDASGHLIASNDNWRDAANMQAIIDTTIPPDDDMESAILTSLEPGVYTTIVRGSADTTGVAVVEAYDLTQTTSSNSKLSNISTRGLVQSGDNALIGGVIVRGQTPLRVIVRAIGPSVAAPGVLADPTLELRASDGTLIATNDNWRSDQEAEIVATGIAPTSELESAIVRELQPGTYTAIVRGVNDTAGVALVEVYSLQ